MDGECSLKHEVLTWMWWRDCGWLSNRTCTCRLKSESSCNTVYICNCIVLAVHNFFPTTVPLLERHHQKKKLNKNDTIAIGDALQFRSLTNCARLQLNLFYARPRNMFGIRSGFCEVWCRNKSQEVLFHPIWLFCFHISLSNWRTITCKDGLLCGSHHDEQTLLAKITPMAHLRCSHSVTLTVSEIPAVEINLPKFRRSAATFLFGSTRCTFNTVFVAILTISLHRQLNKTWKGGTTRVKTAKLHCAVCTRRDSQERSAIRPHLMSLPRLSSGHEPNWAEKRKLNGTFCMAITQHWGVGGRFSHHLELSGDHKWRK